MGFSTPSPLIVKNPVPPIFNPYAGGNPDAPSMMLQQQAISDQVAAQVEQAAYATQDAGLQEQQIAREAVQFREQQAQGYNSSGVLLQGSPMLILNQTRQLAQQQVQMLAQRAQVQSDMMLRAAMVTQDQGRAQLLGEQAQYIQGVGQFGAQQIMNQAQAGYSPLPLPNYGAAGSALTGLGGIFMGLSRAGVGAPSDPLANPYPGGTTSGNGTWGYGPTYGVTGSGSTYP